MRLFDLHCDTFYRCATENILFDNNSLNVCVNKGKSLDKWIQCFAVWIPDDIDPISADVLFDSACNLIRCECKRLDVNLCSGFSDITINCDKKFLGIITLENARILRNDISRISLLKKNNVKIVTLTWNGDNEIGTGALTDKKTGLTDFGKTAVAALESEGIVIDISHSSEKTFWDTVEKTSRPFVATHSNSYKITPNPRNITDSQFSAIKERGGVVGITFYRNFLNSDPDKASVTDIIKHTEHFLSLGGEDALCFGSDFDGCSLTNDIRGIEDYSLIYEAFLRENYSETLLDKLFFENALKFCQNFDN